MKYDYLVFIGRFQPFHHGHARVLDMALKLSKNVIVLVGSSNSSRSLRNPFSFDERYNLIKRSYPEPNVIVRSIDDHTYNDPAWIKQVYSVVKDVVLRKNDKAWIADGLNDYKIGLIGCNKDHTSYYLKMFPNWGNESVNFLNPISATMIRDALYGSEFENMKKHVHHETYRWLYNEYISSIEYEKMKNHYDFIEQYKKKYGAGPFLTADSLVQIGAHVLLITRGQEYGHGLLALPGGFLNTNEKFKDAAIRELREEVKLKVPVPVIKGSLVNEFIADDPMRSDRGRIISMVHHFKLENETELPKVKPNSAPDHVADYPEVEAAGWYNLADLEPKMFFEDHYHIIKKLTGV